MGEALSILGIALVFIGAVMLGMRLGEYFAPDLFDDF